MGNDLIEPSFDVAYKIFEGFGVNNLLRAKDVSPIFAEAAMYRLTHDFQTFYLNGDATTPFDELVNAFNYIGPTMQSLTYSLMNTVLSHFDDGVLTNFYTLLNMCPNLKTLYLRQQFFRTACLTQRVNLKELRKLQVTSCGMYEHIIANMLRDCTNNLKSLAFEDSSFSGECLKHAPISLRDLSFVYSIESADHLIEYTIRNPDLVSLLLYHDRIRLDLSKLCPNLQHVTDLELICSKYEHLESLATLKRLKKLTLGLIHTDFLKYSNALTGKEQQLNRLKLSLSDTTITNAVAQSMANFESLEYIELYMSDSVIDSHLMLTGLTHLRNLKFVQFNITPVDLYSVCLALPQINALFCEIKPDCDGYRSLHRFTNLKEFGISVTRLLPEHIGVDVLSTTINQYITTVAKMERILLFTIDICTPIGLTDETLTALRASKLEIVYLKSGFSVQNIIKFIQNTPALEMLNISSGFTKRELLQMQSVRPRLDIRINADMFHNTSQI